MADGENLKPGEQFQIWLGFIVKEVREVRDAEGSTESFTLVFGVETMRWPTAARKARK